MKKRGLVAAVRTMVDQMDGTVAQKIHEITHIDDGGIADCYVDYAYKTFEKLFKPQTSSPITQMERASGIRVFTIWSEDVLSHLFEEGNSPKAQKMYAVMDELLDGKYVEGFIRFLGRSRESYKEEALMNIHNYMADK